jgi:hypothetical protein
MDYNDMAAKRTSVSSVEPRKKPSAAKPQPKEFNRGFHGFHGFRFSPSTPPTEKNLHRSKRRQRRGILPSFPSFPSVQKEIRAIRAIRGKIFVERSDVGISQRKRSFVYAPFAPFGGYSHLPICRLCNGLPGNLRRERFEIVPRRNGP